MFNKIILFLLSMYFFSQYVYADTSLTWSSNNVDCPSEVIYGVTSPGVPSYTTSSAPTAGNLVCNNRFFTSYSDYTKAYTYNGGQTGCAAGELVVGISGSNITCRRYSSAPLPFYGDNDSYGRSSIIGYVTSTGTLENIFWNNTKSSAYIAANINNADNFYEKIGAVTNGNVILSINKSSSVRLVRFNKSSYDTSKELISNQVIDGIAASGSGYIQNNLSISSSKTGNEYSFNFRDNDYALFLNNTSAGILNYKITAETNAGLGIYINPIDDSLPSEIRVLGWHMIINNGVYIGKQLEYTVKK